VKERLDVVQRDRGELPLLERINANLEVLSTFLLPPLCEGDITKGIKKTNDP